MSWGSQKKKKRAIFVPFILPEGIFLTNVFYLNVQYVLNTLSEYTYIYMLKNITSYTFLYIFKIVGSRQSIFNYLRFLESHFCVYLHYAT